MSIRRIIAIALIVLGTVVLAYSGLTFKTSGRPIDIGPVHVQTTHRHFIPPVGGAIAIAAGLVLWVVGSKRG